ncbi:hypothetical protein EDD21DRAFT_380413 [Dissophora ornata]|nr:hypothetical protein EDD21DRAFT_380413 [Dissophora ornata]
MATVNSSAVNALSSAELAEAFTRDDGDFVGCLYDTILYERACYRLYELKKYDFPLKYDELANDFITAYRLCLEPKFLANRHTAAFAHLILQSKLLTTKGVRVFALEYLGNYELFPSGDPDIVHGEDINELDEGDFSDYDSVEHGMDPIRKNVGYDGPLLTRRSQGHFGGPIAEGQAHREIFSTQYAGVYKHSQDMIAAIIAHLRKHVWFHNGSGGEIIEIQNMGVNGADFVARNGNNKDSIGDDGTRVDRPIKNVKGVKKYTRRFNGKRKRRNYEKAKERGANGGFWQQMTESRDPPTDYSDSETEGEGAKGEGTELEGIDADIEKLAALSLAKFSGSPKRPIRWLAGVNYEDLYDWKGVNNDLRLIDLSSEDVDPTFYGRLTRDIMIKYKELLPPSELMDRHKQLKSTLEDVITTEFPAENFKVEAFGSFVSGLLMANSDADFCIIGENIHEHQSLNDMNYLASLLRSKGGMEKVFAVPNAMVPIVKFQDPRTKMECDLNTGNNLGVVNSELIRAYTTIDERVKPFLYMIKAICKAQGINDSRSGYLSSYAITWIGIVFLQQELQLAPAASAWGWDKNSVLPKLQQQPFERMRELTLRINHNTKNAVTSATSLVNSSKSDMVHCRFDDNKDGFHTGSGRVNKKSLARLLIDFFEYFSRHFNYTTTAIHVGRASFVSKTSRELRNEIARPPTFRVVDPFLHHRNITGTCRGESLARVWRAFDHSYRMLSAGDLEGAMVNVE